MGSSINRAQLVSR